MRISTWLLFIFFVIAIPLVGYSKDNPKKKRRKSSGLSWAKYHRQCGSGNLEREANFERFKGKSITWHGKVAEIEPESAFKNGHALWASDIIRVKMSPSDALRADVRLRIPKVHSGKIANVKPGIEILFKGKIMYLGTKMTDHIVEVEKFGKYKKNSKK